VVISSQFGSIFVVLVKLDDHVGYVAHGFTGAEAVVVVVLKLLVVDCTPYLFLDPPGVSSVDELIPETCEYGDWYLVDL